QALWALEFPMHEHPIAGRAALAYENEEFLNTPDARTLRVLAEYLEPQSRLRRQNVQDTIVFFGSARIPSSEAASSALALADDETRPAAERALALLRRRPRVGPPVDVVVAIAAQPPPPLCHHIRRRPGHHASCEPGRAR